jgi:glycosyltransferase involved in cell wall biosynthesis
MENKRISILYTYVQKRSFVTTDLERLSQYYSLSSFAFPSKNKFLTPFVFLKQALYLMLNGWRYDYFACFFAGHHSLLPSLFAKLTGKKCVIFLGGTDCFKYPSFHYGNFTRKWYGRSTCISAHNASLLVPVSSNLIQTTSPYYKVDSVTQGIYHWCKNLKTPYKIVSTEYDPELFQRKDVTRVENSFMTIAFDIEGVTFIRKGIDKVVMIASHFPEFRFTIVGCAPEDFPVPVPANVKLVPPIPHSMVPEYLSAHRFYLQLSIAEGLPNAVCEAMLCECIPIGSAVAAIPEAIGDFGFIASEREDDIILDAVRKAVDYPDKENMGKKGREHIISKYGPGKRINALREIFS